MTTPPLLTLPPGLGYSVHKRPSFSTKVSGHVSGREVRAAFMAYPLWEFELTIAAMASNAKFPGLGTNSLQSLMGQFLQAQGQFGTFLFDDPTDDGVAAQALGTGDGSTTEFTLVRTLGGWVEPIGWINTLSAVYLNGTPTSAYTLTAPNTITFTSAPSLGVAVAADFTFYFLCRFLEDSQDFEQFMSNLWLLKSLKFRSVKYP